MLRRALRVVNPSPYMFYMQARGSTLVSSSPEILCKVDIDRVVTNRWLLERIETQILVYSSLLQNNMAVVIRHYVKP